MKRAFYIINIVFLASLRIVGQDHLSLSGKVVDEQGLPLTGCHVHLDTLCSITDLDGNFLFETLLPENYEVTASFVGFKNFRDTIFIDKQHECLNIQLARSTEQLEEIVVVDNYIQYRKSESTTNIEIVDGEFVQKNLAGSFMKSLERMPGLNTIDIGSGQSKPIIRGLSFNRVVIAESGIKHEAQQWGADHGLEIDQFNVEEVEVIKGPASLLYGSDAIGGVVNIKPYNLPATGEFNGSVTLHGKTNNGLIGGSLNANGRKKSLFFSTRLTGFTSGDYRVPADKVTYNTYDFDLINGYLRNTAGRELNAYASVGLVGEKGVTSISLGNYFNKSGFYADVHGLEIRDSQIDFDAANRDIDLPYQQVNHFKAISNSTLFFKENKLDIDLSFQNNFRQEYSEPTEHGYRPLPPNTLEREFNKNTWTGNAIYTIKLSGRNSLKTGINLEFQKNEIGGWGFIIPAFKRFTSGLFVFDKFNLTERLYLNAGMRYDLGNLQIEKYTDWYPTPVFDEDGNEIGETYKQRVPDLVTKFNNYSFSAGIGYSGGKWLLKFNIGKSFRMPDARELATDGVNYHLYRQEKGDLDITSEKAWQGDIYLEYQSGKTKIVMSPFYSYFPNFIYLNPTSAFSDETGLQVFQYVQNEVVRWGGEMEITQKLISNLEFGLGAEYVYSEQLTGEKKGFGLAFSPPPAAIVDLTWKPVFKGTVIGNTYFTVDLKMVSKQERIVPPEEPTDGYQSVNLYAGTNLLLADFELKIHLQLKNLFNATYYNHTSYYRLINVPEPGRNFQLTLIIPFNSKLKN